MDNTKYYVGTELKIAIDIQCEGFNMDEHNWTCTVKRCNKQIVCDRTHNSACEGERHLAEGCQGVQEGQWSMGGTDRQEFTVQSRYKLH